MRLVDADALIQEAMERYCKDCERRKGIKNGKLKIVYNIGDAPCRACGTGDMIDELENAPTAEPERKKGKWIYEERKRLIDETDDGPVYCMEKWWKCSECGDAKGFVPFEPEDNFCPNCGADMREEEPQKFSSCENCQHYGKDWYEEPCDSCTFGGVENHFEPWEGEDHE